jgi:hypothetical protein
MKKGENIYTDSLIPVGPRYGFASLLVTDNSDAYKI